MKKKQIFLISILILFIYSSTYSQKLELDIPSPQSYDFIRYGNIPISGYTGSLGLTIPIYQYSDNDFSFNIDVKYSSSGFKPNKRSGIVGQDWFLNAGGTITRSINGLPDDIVNFEKIYDSGASTLTSGYYSLAKLKVFNNDDLSNIDYGNSELRFYEDDFRIKYNDVFYETQPDIFNFNFMGYSGKFFFDANGKAQVVSESGKFKIDFSNFSTQNGNSQADEMSLNNSEIKITDSKGYIYIFGGELKYLEYSIDLNKNGEDNLDPNGMHPRIISWILKKVTSPNGRELILEYKDFVIPNDDSVDLHHYLLIWLCGSQFCFSMKN